MNRKPLIKGLLRLFAVSVMLTAVLALAPSREVKATPDVCITNLSYCYWQCAYTHHQGDPPTGPCEYQCELNYNTCNEEETDELPAPYPVISHSRSSCLQGCLQCNKLEDFDRQSTCYDACWNWCDANYPKP